MPRTRKVDRKEAKQKAMSAFWRSGYNQLGVRALEEATGINRFTLQTEFGGKAGLFLSILNDYLELSQNIMFAELHNGGLEEIAQVFLRRADNSQLPQETNCGCLVVNTACENDGSNEDINKRIHDFMEISRNAFKAALENERKKGTLNNELNIDDAAEFLRSEMFGLNVVAKSKGNNEATGPAARFTAQLVRSWRA